MPLSGFAPFEPVLVFLREPREKLFGVLLGIDTAGVSVRALDLGAVDDFLRQEARAEGEPQIAPATLFYPLHRVERLERDESVGALPGLAERARRETGRDVVELFGLQREA